MSISSLKSIQFSEIPIQQRLIQKTLGHISEAVMYMDASHRIVYVNERFQQLTGLQFYDVSGKTPQELTKTKPEFSFYSHMLQTAEKHGYWQSEIWNQHENGQIYLQSVIMMTNKDDAGNIQQYIVVFSKDRDHQLYEKELTADAASSYDTLTSLPNRLLFEKHVMHAIQQPGTSTSLAVVFFQLERFADFNEKYGILFGNMVLKHLAARLNHHFYHRAIFSRWKGTEFACILKDVTNQQEIHASIEVIREKISAPMNIKGFDISLQAKFGVDLYTQGTSVSDFFSNAKAALQQAKKTEEPIVFYRKTMEKSEELFLMEAELRQAIKEKQFELYYQPLICTKDKTLLGFEGLIRWNHPTKGVVPPVAFIPFAEQIGLIGDIGRLVFEKACRQIADWEAAGFDFGKIHVNISMNELHQSQIVEQFAAVLETTKINPDKIGIELTESSTSLNMEDTINKVKALEKLGLSIAIDDFGTGFSSFDYLIDFPIQRIKIDRSFMKALGNNKKISAIVMSIALMGETMGLEVVAEGIETEEQLQQARRLNCNVVQGYLFDRPLPKEVVEEKWFRTV